MSINLPLGGLLADFDAGRLALVLVLLCIVGQEVLASFVGVLFSGFFAVGLVQFVLGSAGLDAKEIVEGNIGALGFGYLVAEAENLVV